METLKNDFSAISIGLIVLAIGVIAFFTSLFRIKYKDYSLFNFALFSLLSGLRWFTEIPTIKELIGFPFSHPYFHGLLTYLMPIPFSALLINIYGRGIYNSLLLVFYSSILYLVIAVPIDLMGTQQLAEVYINRILVVIWGIVWITNVLLIKRKQDIELTVLKIVFLIVFISVIINNVNFLKVELNSINIEGISFVILFIGFGFVAVHHTFNTDKKLQAIEQEIEIAKKIQQSNLPSTIISPKGLNIATKYVPMTTVAGDFYDVKLNDDNGVGILIADVSGHGVGAALIGSMIKIAYASQSENLANPAHILTEINRMLFGNIEDSFVTAFALYIDINKKQLKYSGAGHPPTIVLNKLNKEIRKLDMAGTIIGPFQNHIYENHNLDIDASDRIVLFTDGIIETMNKNDEFFDDAGLESFIKETSALTVQQTSENLIKTLSLWTGKSRSASFDDDLTLIIIDLI